MIFPYVIEGENSFYFLNIARTIRTPTKIEEIVMVHGANTAKFFTLKCDSSNNRYDFGTWGSKSSLQ